MSGQKRNYAKELEELLAGLSRTPPPRLLLHACCAPCASYVLSYLSPYFSIDLLYWNPNISPEAEYRKREEELKRLVAAMPLKGEVVLVPSTYEPAVFFEMAKGMEALPEGDARCKACYRLRLEEAAKVAKLRNCAYFTTTLSISPMKDADALNAIGEELAAQYAVPHLPGNFKKKNGYGISIKLSKEYGLYRQDYCGCVFSKRARVEANG